TAGPFHRDFLRRAVRPDEDPQHHLTRDALAHGLRRVLGRPHPAVADVFARRDVLWRRRRRGRCRRRRGHGHRRGLLDDDRRRGRRRRRLRRRLHLLDHLRRRLLRRLRRRWRRWWWWWRRFDELDRHLAVDRLVLWRRW